MKVLVTGATGFIGLHLVQKLAEEGSEVICLVRKTSCKKRVEMLTKLGAQIYYGDITNEGSLKHLPADVDIIYHLAALVDHSLVGYEPYYQINVIGTRNLIERFLNSDLKKFVFVSSIAAIGLVKTKTGLVNESVRCHPVTSYGKSKHEAEKLLFHYFNYFKFPVIILRPPVVYGPGGKGSFFETVKFVKQKIERGRPIFYVNRGSALTSLCYIDNLVDALTLVMKSKHVGEIFHIDDGRPYTHKEILTTIASILGKRPVEIYVPKIFLYVLASTSDFLNATLGVSLKGLSRAKAEALSTNMAFDTSKAKKYLGYTPICNFNEFVRKTIVWYTQNKLL